MILKVVESDPRLKSVGSTGPEKSGNIQERSWIFDKLSRVLISGPITTNIDDYLAEEDDSVRLVCGIHEDSHGKTSSPPMRTFYRIGCLTEDDDEFTILSGYHAYLMNDEGVTIERLRVM